MTSLSLPLFQRASLTPFGRAFKLINNGKFKFHAATLWSRVTKTNGNEETDVQKTKSIKAIRIRIYTAALLLLLLLYIYTTLQSYTCTFFSSLLRMVCTVGIITWLLLNKKSNAIWQFTCIVIINAIAYLLAKARLLLLHCFGWVCHLA